MENRYSYKQLHSSPYTHTLRKASDFVHDVFFYISKKLGHHRMTESCAIFILLVPLSPRKYLIATALLLHLKLNFSLVTSYQLRVTSCQLLVTSYQLLVTSYYLLVTIYQLLVTSYQLLVTTHQLLVTSYQPLVTKYQSLIIF